MLENPDTRALYLFPTKALAQDQLAEIHDLNSGWTTVSESSPTMATRRVMHEKRSAKGHIVLTNPDMLHTGILPHHTQVDAAVREPALHRAG